VFRRRICEATSSLSSLTDRLELVLVRWILPVCIEVLQTMIKWQLTSLFSVIVLVMCSLRPLLVRL
jgi:hypothetical protein